ncbi:MAG: substrate-binding domain-containing protein, partial [bacterium]
GILSAARALGLEFIPIAKEQYDLLIPERYADLSWTATLLAILRGKEFKQALSSLGGYDCTRTGEITCLG